jgi:hypothetical protein
MKKITKKILKKTDIPGAEQKDIKQTTNAIFKQYKKSFKDLARYDRGEKISVN